MDVQEKTVPMKLNLIEQIVQYTHDCPENWYADIGEHYFADPIVKIADAADPLFDEYKAQIGEIYQTPKEAYELTFGADTFNGGSVISILLPTGTSIRESNRKQTEWASKEWAVARAYNDKIYKSISEYLETLLRDAGYNVVTPLFSDWYKVQAENGDFKSSWSERHAAYIAGQGTFGLNDGFISEKGITVKFVSVLTNLVLEPDKRTADSYYANCLYLTKGTCGACIKRCPVGAITEKGHDKAICYQRCYGRESRALAESYGGSGKAGAGCALCQVGIPCEFRSPV